VNDLLPRRVDWLSRDPCGDGWMACLSITQYEQEAEQGKPRRILLVNGDPKSADEQERKLTALGCVVQRACDRECLLGALKESEGRVVFLDAASFGDAGPDLAGLINQRAAALRIVVVGAAAGALESSYRKHKIFYYAIEPFADEEIADILAGAFRLHEAQPAERAKGPSEPISSITITNRNGHHVQLLAAPGLLWRNEGLGYQIGHKLLTRMLPVVITPGVANLAPANILKAATTQHRLMVLLAKDHGQLPGSLARDTKPDFGVEPGEASGKITTLAVQPDAVGGLANVDARTITALAEHIVREMAAY
jgi:ActR/RegA family two-component response regulator